MVSAIGAICAQLVTNVLCAACCRYEPGPLERRQQRLFDPLLTWAHQELGWQLHPSSSIHGTTQPDATVAAVLRYLEGELHAHAGWLPITAV